MILMILMILNDIDDIDDMHKNQNPSPDTSQTFYLSYCLKEPICTSKLWETCRDLVVAAEAPHPLSFSRRGQGNPWP